MKIDIHTHCWEGVMRTEDIVNQIKKKNLSGICITEHSFYHRGGKIWEEVERLAKEIHQKDGIFAVQGIEVYTDLADFLIFGEMDKECFKNPKRDYGWKLKDIFNDFKREEIAIIWAHPFRRKIGMNEDIKRYILENVDGIEVLNGNHQKYFQHYDDLAKDMALSLGEKVALLGGSDAHHFEDIGNCYTLFLNEIKDEKDLVREIKERRVLPSVFK